MNTLAGQIGFRLPLRVTMPVLPALALILLATMLLSLSLGAVSIPLSSLLSDDLSEQQRMVLGSIRLPRVLLCALVGAALSMSGAAMQGLFRNPLADPALIGIAGGAAFAVACVIVLGGAFTGLAGFYGLSLAAFGGSLLTALLVFRFASLGGGQRTNFSVTCMLLAGIAVNAITWAGMAFLTYLSTDQQMRSLTFWTMGSFSGALWPSVIACATLVLPAMFLLIQQGKALNLLMLGEREAEYLGLDAERVKRRIIFCTALSVGASVAVSGVIGFVGLVVPHLLRLILGPDNRALMPASALFGASLLVIADTAARLIVSPAEMPVGILTALIGGPFFLWLLTRQFGRTA